MLTGMSRFVLSWTDDRNRFVAIDSSSNYPYKVELPRALFWDSEEEATKYKDHFHGKLILEMVRFELCER